MNEEACMVCRRCPSRDPTCQYRPTSRGQSYFIVRGEILGFMKDEQLRKHLPRMFLLIKNESWALEDDHRPSLKHKRCRPGVGGCPDIVRIDRLSHEPSHEVPVKMKTTVVGTKCRTLVFWANRGWGPHTHSLFCIREIEEDSMSQQPERVRRHLHGTWRTANALRSTPRRDHEGRSTRRKWDVGQPCAPVVGIQHKETDVGRGKQALEPRNEEACMVCHRCPSRDPTCQYRPTTTHALYRPRCSSTQSIAHRPQRV
ncbi:hypothetical protein BUALT_Bualt07G0083800 [Buddleja alternifolia]|uniref:Zn(2)-C6 fungal-type domain-containing protein n=1 Tax=Buddleja alternifolia TaxID=168488 RepID=A0AAV6XFQ4_9LAMI|nr:hypothetical protein BUALT_Bualt07G0083800 [Buddleja alternifolia]